MLRSCAAFLIVAFPAHASAQEWPRFRGPNGAGVSPSAAVWTEADRLWKVKLPGKGHASPVLWGDRLFITSGDPKTEQRAVYCLDAKDGSTLWSRHVPVAKHGQHPDNSFASGTPAADEKRVYVPWASPKDYMVVAFDHAGAEAWRVDLGPFRSGHGFGVSLIVHDGLVIVPHEHEGKSAIVALDRDTGKIRWQAPRRSRTTYATPCLFQPQNQPAQLIFGNYEHGITSLDPKTGSTNWEIDVFDKGHLETSIASPIVAGDLIIGCSGWLGVKMEVIAVRPPLGNGKGGAGGKAEVAYRLTRGAPLVPTPLVKDDLLFLWDDDGVIACADARTGKMHWRERVDGKFYASPVWAGGRLINVTRGGEVVALAADKKFKELDRFSLGENSYATPAIAGDVLYVRTFRHVHAYAGRRIEER
ncbi:MAG: PQQ-like beta-propeller repeat protein [Gemmataceae bacterium]|nr:PQQ-like beta-propeller repeat protein [Gemmataceae bacterium]